MTMTTGNRARELLRASATQHTCLVALAVIMQDRGCRQHPDCPGCQALTELERLAEVGARVEALPNGRSLVHLYQPWQVDGGPVGLEYPSADTALEALRAAAERQGSDG